MGVETALLVGSLVATVASTGYSMYSQSRAADKAEHAANYRADLENEAAAQDAANIREKAARLRGMQQASLAASGVKIDSGTSDVLLGETDRLSEQDALAAIKEGGQRAEIIKSQGQLTADNYRSQAIASALGGVSSILGGVSSYREATKGSRVAASVDLDTDKALSAKGLTTKKPTYSLLGG